MIVTPLPPERLILPPGDIPRGEGVHQSAIIRCIATETGILKAEWAEELSLVDAREITDQVAILRIMMGLAWEQYYLPKVKGVIYQPGQMQVDGIYMTPDGESIDIIHTLPTKPWGRLLHECKATYKSTNTVGNLEEQWMWLAQCMGYCKGMETLYAMMHILFVCGDYTYPIKPVLRKFLIVFTQEEIDGNWNTLRDYRDNFVEMAPEMSEDVPMRTDDDTE